VSTVAPAARAALTQATALAPGRSTASDGLTGDAAHRDRVSLHNPSHGDGVWDDDGVVLAFDLTHDPAAGCDAHQLVRDAVARHDPRIREAISLDRIWTLARSGEGWRPYNGPNPHTRHAHVGLTWDFRNDTRPWWGDEDDMPLTDTDVQRIAQATAKVIAGPRRPDHADDDKAHVETGDLLTAIEALGRKVDALAAKVER
jgi:hypothetical protein